MSFVIKSGASADEATVDPVSKALRVTAYDSAGNEVNKAPLGSFLLPINMGRLTAAIGAASAIWTMRNITPARTVKIRRVLSNVAFDGTAAATTALYDWVRFSTATPTGGTTVTPIKKRTGNPTASSVTDARQNAGAALGVAGVVFESSFFSIGNQRQVAAGKTADLRFEVSGQDYDNFELASGEGMAIRLNVASVIGDSISGGVTWDEVA